MGKKNYGSVFGQPYQRFKYLLKYLDRYYKTKIKILIVDAKDGQHVLPALRKGYFVDCYETNFEYLEGGIIDGYKIVGLYNKLDYFYLSNKTVIINKNFYEEELFKEYYFVYCYKSLHLSTNSSITLKKKINKLQNAVKKNGFLYIYYHLAENEHDYINYPSNKYFRRGEMIKYFNDSWEIIYLIENNLKSIDFPHPGNNKKHMHLVGHILAKKKYKERTYKYNYNITYYNIF